MLDHDPVVAARYHLDKHVVKMVLESAQLLSTAHRILDDANDPVLYRTTHKNHPCSVWVRQSTENYLWLYSLFIALCDEYTYRYGKIHLTDKKLRTPLATTPINMCMNDFTEPAQAMPPAYKDKDFVAAYRKYYIHEKYKFAKWTKRNVPEWFMTVSEDSNANV